MSTRPNPEDRENFTAPSTRRDAERIREVEAHAKLVDELDRLRAAFDTLGPAFADAAANVRRFLDGWEEKFGDVQTVSLLWTDGMPEVPTITVADLRALIDVDPRDHADDGDIDVAEYIRAFAEHRRRSLAEAARVQARGPYHPLEEGE